MSAVAIGRRKHKAKSTCFPRARSARLKCDRALAQISLERSVHGVLPTRKVVFHGTGQPGPSSGLHGGSSGRARLQSVGLHCRERRNAPRLDVRSPLIPCHRQRALNLCCEPSHLYPIARCYRFFRLHRQVAAVARPSRPAVRPGAHIRCKSSMDARCLPAHGANRLSDPLGSPDRR